MLTFPRGARLDNARQKQTLSRLAGLEPAGMLHATLHLHAR